MDSLFSCACVRKKPPVVQYDPHNVYLNVYHITKANVILQFLGLGMHHSGVEVHGFELGFGRDVTGATGVFRIPPKSYQNMPVTESIFLGRTELTKDQVHAVVISLRAKWNGRDYHLTKKNCNDFSEEVTELLLPKKRRIAQRSSENDDDDNNNNNDDTSADRSRSRRGEAAKEMGRQGAYLGKSPKQEEPTVLENGSREENLLAPGAQEFPSYVNRPSWLAQAVLPDLWNRKLDDYDKEIHEERLKSKDTEDDCSE